MNPHSTATQKVTTWLTVLFVIAFHATMVRADSTDGGTPLALQPGAPAGSYALSDLDNINPYNGSLNFRLPLMSLGGRGPAGYTMMLPFEQKWRINANPIYEYVYEDGGNGPLPDPHVTYHYFPSANWWSGIKPGYGPGVLQGRVAQFGAQVCPDSRMQAEMTLTRLTFTAPDGTEFELRDKQTDGAPAGVGLCDLNGLNRGKIFVSADGSAATFISDQNIVDYIVVPNGGNDLFYASGYLLLRDGTRYRFDNGTVTWLRDRNGNQMTFTYDSFKRVTSIKDSINREVTITYATSSILYDDIVYKGFGGTTRTIRVNYAFLQDAGSLRSGYSIQTYAQLFPNTGLPINSSYNPKIVRSVTLPNNQQYQFQYNPYGELARVVLPTGGAFEYDYDGGVVGGFDEYALNVFRVVVARRVYSDGTTLESKITFTRPETSPCSGCVVIDQFGSDGTTRISQRRLYYEGNPINSFSLAPTDYSPWKDGKEYQSESVAADGTTVLRRSTRTWQQPVAGGSWPLTQAETNAAAKANNPQVTQTSNTLEPSQANKVSKQTFGYDKYTNQTDVYEYDFGNGAAGPLVRRSHTDYLTSGYDTLNPSSTNPDLSQTSHIRNLPRQVSIFDAAGVERARSVIEYDNYVLDGADCGHSFHCSLIARSNISGLDTLSHTMRGNATASTRYLFSNGTPAGSVSSYSQYDVAGNVVRVLDPRSTLSNNIAATIEYDDRFGAPDNEARSNSAPVALAGLTSFAFPTKVVNSLGHTSYAQFDYYLGKPVNGEDANGIVASGNFSDALDRLVQVIRAIGTGTQSQTTFAYDDANRIVTTSSDKDAYGDNLLVAQVVYDPMGRTVEARQYEGGTNYIVTQTQYDALGRAYKASNPFRPWQSETALWTTQAFDALGRVTSVTTPDSAVVSTSYSGNSVTVTDPAGKKRRSVSDALGRLIEVYEDPNGLNYQTSYLYDTLDNLVQVTQGSQQRFFMYDSLKRLIRARNPEQGTLASLNLSDPLTGNSAWCLGYVYDAGGNLTQKTDARGVVSTYVYDVLNRNTTIDYSDTASINPDVTRYYDGAINGKGRFWYNYAGGDFSNGGNVEHIAIDSYDAFGKPTVQRQIFKLNGVWGETYRTLRAYNRSGAVKSQTYPSGHTVSYLYDDAGRTSSFTGELGDGANRTYANNIDYSPFGGIQQEQFGTQQFLLYHKNHYNRRGQLFDVRLSTMSWANDQWNWNRGAIVNYYSSNYAWEGNPATPAGPDNNGNVLLQQHWVPTDDAISSYNYTQDAYSYDSLNRLQSASELHVTSTGQSGQDFAQMFVYDRWGNRTINAAQTWGTGINNKQFTVDAATNRLGVPSGQAGTMTYDAAGNLTTDTYTGVGNRSYDAENRMTTAADNTGQISRYTYNAEGKRVRRQVASSQEEWLVYGIDGELLAEYQAGAPASAPEKEYGYRNGQLLVTATGRFNVALAANGAVATASTAHTCCGFSTTGAINGNNRGPWGNGEGWNDATPDQLPDWFRVDFAGSKTIDEIDVFSLHDNYTQENTPTETQTFTLYGLLAFDVQYWNGSSWVTVPGGSVTGNNKVWRKFTFAPITTSKIRLWITSVPDSWSRLVELQAWGTGGGGAPDTAGLVGQWKFDENSGTTAADSSGNGNTGTLSSGATWATGQSGSALSLDGVDDYVQVGAQSSLVMSSAATFSAWIYPTGPGSHEYIGGIIVNKEGEYEITRFPDGTIQWAFANTSPGWNWTNTGYVAPLNQWTHVSITYDNGVVKTYINGTLTHTYSGSGTIGDVMPTQNDFRIGGRQGLSNNFQGRIDEVRVYNRALSASEVATLSNNSVSSGGAQVNWLVTDQLGTPRIIVDETGSLTNVKRHDYLPFGEELFAPAGGRSAAQGYSSGDGVRQQFTAQERDIETGLDYFLARYYSSTHGRFVSADSFAGTISNPQSLNRYAYVGNNPLRFIDPSGNITQDPTLGKCGPNCQDPQTPPPIPKLVQPGSAGTSISGTADNGRPFDATLVRMTELGEFKESSPNLFQRMWSGIRKIFPGISAGTTVGGGAGIGAGLLGAGGIGSVQSGLFYDVESGHINAGNTAAGGLVLGAHNFLASNPTGPELRLPRVPGESMVAGAFWEVGGGLWFSNAKSVRDLAGPFQTGHFNLILAALQVDKGDNGVRVWSFTMGPGNGAGVYKSPTTAAVLWDSDSVFPPKP